MNFTRRDVLTAVATGVSSVLAACGPAVTVEEPEPVEETLPKKPEIDLEEFAKLELDMTAWRYDDANECYYQLGLTYCINPSSSLEELAIFVPATYFKGKQGRNTYTCVVNPRAKVGSFSARTAPVVMPINAVRYGAQEPPAAYGPEGIGRYLKAGCIYVYAGFRGRSSGYESDSNEVVPGGAPWAVVDLKAAVRYLRYNAAALPGSMDRIFTFGMGGAGGISAVLAASGDSTLFEPYLASIGAATHDAEGKTLSDATFGTASWCPLMSFDVADGAYEWECGQYSVTGARAEGEWGRLLSSSLVSAYAAWVNAAGLTDGEGNPMTLDAVGDGSFTAGPYYDHVLAATEQAAADFLTNTQFPYTYTPAPAVPPAFPGNPNLTFASDDDVDAALAAASGVASVQATVYDSVDAYVEALNNGSRWLTYNAWRGTVRITGLWDMAAAVRRAALGMGAFDAADRSTATNQLFGLPEETTLHFSAMVGNCVAEGAESYAGAQGWDPAYPDEWRDDLAKEDALDHTMAQRVDMMNPLYFVCPSYAGYGTAQVAPYWRMNAGLFQAQTSLAAVANLALAVGHYEGVVSAAFTPVWGRGFELAERAGDAQDNFVAWVVQCCTSE